MTCWVGFHLLWYGTFYSYSSQMILLLWGWTVTVCPPGFRIYPLFQSVESRQQTLLPTLQVAPYVKQSGSPSSSGHFPGLKLLTPAIGERGAAKASHPSDTALFTMAASPTSPTMAYGQAGRLNCNV